MALDLGLGFYLKKRIEVATIVVAKEAVLERTMEKKTTNLAKFR